MRPGGLPNDRRRVPDRPYAQALVVTTRQPFCACVEKLRSDISGNHPFPKIAIEIDDNNREIYYTCQMCGLTRSTDDVIGLW